MDFYDNLSKYYDDIFPFDAGTFAFLVHHLPKPPAAVLDVGCATGAYLHAFRDAGYSPRGVEYVPSLIRTPDMALQGDMRSLPADFAGQFRLVTCIGNTLVHLNSTKELTDTFAGFRTALADKGAVVFQILNYHRILKLRTPSLPLIDRGHVRFDRRYHYTDDGKIRFEGIITETGTGTATTSAVTLTPFTPDEVRTAATTAGFGNVQFYGSFDLTTPFDAENSFLLVGVLT